MNENLFMNIIKMNEIKKKIGSVLLNKRISFTSAVLVVVLLSSSPAHAIKKCKDADGQWHYGDVAVRACQNSKVTTLSASGAVREQKDAPKSEEQREAEVVGLAELEAERLEQEQIENEKSRILTVYETEADIDQQRESRLYSIDNNIAVHHSYINSLKEHIAFDKKKLRDTTNVGIKEQIEDKIAETEKNVNDYTKEIDALKAKREEVVKRFDNEKAIYRELTKANKAS